MGALHRAPGGEALALDRRTPAIHAHVLDQPGRALYLRLDTTQLVLQVGRIGGAVLQAFERIDHRHAHHVERLVDLVQQAGGQLAEGSHLGPLQQLLLAAPHLGVVTAHGLDLEQAAFAVEHAAVGPDPPGMLTARQLQADLRAAHRSAPCNCSGVQPR
ncbi:hypothetical protein WR25_06665 [Diploscapter pachys]|uniref:Uncharacterized protein n=1 Tax=Diploscapter pachys TaxID=2018661 RepID=A0A2A2KEF8_9BILA|nr:hypothetical protein WR25_06665 [Diploscapter pachys]